MSENTKWGVQKRFQQGRVHMPTTYFLGYDTDKDGNIVIDEEQAAVVRRIFKEFLEGKGTPTIAKGLMKDSILTARGNKKWTGDGVYKILKQEKYQGHCLAQKTVTIDFLTHKRVPNKDLQPQYYVKNTHPAIISEEDFNAVQQELKRRNKMLRDPDNKYRQTYSGKAPFSNKFFCGECGRPVIRRRLTSKRNNEQFHFSAWQCRVASGREPDFKECRSRYSWETNIEKAFMEVLYEMKETKETVISDAKKAIQACSLTEAEQTRLAELDKQLEAINNRISELSKRESATSDAIYDTTMRHLIYEQEIIQQEYDDINDNKQESIYLEKHLNELLEQLKGLEEDENFRDDIFAKTVERGILYHNYEVTFEFKCGIKRNGWTKKTKKK
ncbi:hypothetical protein GGQ84_002733 [Desulfitispora alkaliphila]